VRLERKRQSLTIEEKTDPKPSIETVVLAAKRKRNKGRDYMTEQGEKNFLREEGCPISGCQIWGTVKQPQGEGAWRPLEGRGARREG